MKKIKAKIVVNLITFIRVIGTFLIPFVNNYLSPQQFIIYIALIFMTDTLDGMLARLFKVCTLFGAILDSAADKLFGIATLLVLARVYPIMYLLVILEIVILLINTISGSKGANSKSSKIGKCKTWILAIAIVLGYITVYSKSFITIIENQYLIGRRLYNTLVFILNNQKIFISTIAIVTFIFSLIVAIDYYLRNHKEVIKNKINTKKIRVKQGKELLIALFDEEFYEKTKNEPLIYRLGREVT